MALTRRTTLVALAALPIGAAARAETSPARPLTIVVPYAAGSATDTLARLMAEQLAPKLGQSVIVDNKGGGNGSIAGGIVAHAAPDGYTIMMATAATTAGNPNMMKSLPYDSLKDFAPAGFIGSLQFVLLTRNEPGTATLADFIARAKRAKPPLTSGAGTPSARVITATLGERIGAELVYVPYKAAPLALADLLSGQIDMTFGDVSIAVPQVKAGKVKALVLASDSASALLPGVPTFEQAGLGQFSLDAWFVLLAPAKTPPEIVEKIDKAVQEIVVDPKVVDRLHGISFEPRRMAGVDVQTFIKSEIEKWGRLAKAAGIEKSDTMIAPKRLEFGWFLPTAGDTTAYGVASAQIAPSLDLFDKVVAAAETAGFEYMLVPVQTACWEAWISSAMMVARSKSMRMLVAARPSYINPVLLAKMISAFDQLSGGRICINLIAGQSEAENESEGVKWGKEERYEIMDEEVSILKALWTTRGPVTYDGKFHQLKGAQIRPATFQKPHPPFYLGGGSRQAWEISAKHSDVHLFWGDTYERIRANMAEIRTMAARHGREKQIGFGMRLQIVCRQTEKEAWEFARGLVSHASEAQKAFVRERFATSEANRRVRELAAGGDVIERNLWTGITQVRPGAGIAVVGTPEQCADTLQDFIDLGCHSFCLSGYLHDEEAERFGNWVMPILRQRNRERMLAA